MEIEDSGLWLHFISDLRSYDKGAAGSRNVPTLSLLTLDLFHSFGHFLLHSPTQIKKSFWEKVATGPVWDVCVCVKHISGFCDELTRNRFLGLIRNIVSLILFHQHVAGHPETLQRTVDWEQRYDDWLDVLITAANVLVGVVSSLVSRRRFNCIYPSDEPSIKNPVAGPCFCDCGCGIKGPVQCVKLGFIYVFFMLVKA